MKKHSNSRRTIAQLPRSPTGLVTAAAALVALLVPHALGLAAETELPVGRLIGPSGTVVSYGSDGKSILVAGNDVARVWDAVTFKPVTPPLEHGSAVTAAHISDDRKVAVTSGGTDVKIWEIPNGKLIGLLKHDSELLATGFERIGSRMVTGCSDGTARVWDVASKRLIRSIKHPGGVRYAAFSPDGTHILTCSAFPHGAFEGREWVGAVLIWDVRTGRLSAKREADFFGNARKEVLLSPAAFSANGDRVASSFFKYVTVWGVADAKRILTVEPLDAAAFTAFGPSDTQLLTVSGVAEVWDVSPRSERPQRIGSFGSAVTQAAFGPDGRTLLTVDRFGVDVWQLPKGDVLRNVRTRVDDKLTAALSPDGSTVAVSRRHDGVTEIWAVPSPLPQ